MKLNLEQLEARLQAMIEVKLVSALPGFQVEDLVVRKLADAMKSNLVEDADGNKVAPNVFTLVANPNSAERWQEQKLLEAMISSLKAVGEEAGDAVCVPIGHAVVHDRFTQEAFLEVLVVVEDIADAGLGGHGRQNRR